MSSQTEKPLRIQFFLVPHFSMIAFAAAIEPWHSANRAASRPLFEWLLASADGEPVPASNGILAAVRGCLDQLGKLDMAIERASLATEV